MNLEVVILDMHVELLTWDSLFFQPPDTCLVRDLYITVAAINFREFREKY